jgi:CO/xanthine dehydrogenase Mo-binding subunit
MVLIEGQPMRSCLVKMERVGGKRVETIEGIARPGGLHPFQQALIDTSAIQCGFCIPGMVISGVALLARNPEPSTAEIKEALRLNLCRCGGYPKIIKAVQQAAQVLVGQSQPPSPRHYVGQVVGQSIPDKEAEQKVTGQLTFADDMYLEGMLYGKVLWARYPHARILAVDASRAERMPGVAVVLTAKDIPGRNGFGMMVPNQPVLCHEKVRFLGDAVAVVFAESLAIAERARDAIRVDYQELEVVTSPQQALEPGAPQVHEGGNVCRHILRTVGDVEQGFREAAVVVEGDYSTPFVEHAYLEPECGLGVPGPDGRVTVYYPTQMPFENRAQIAASLGVAEDRVRVVSTPLGGGFGGKIDITVHILVALGALRTGRPCKITLTRPESLTLSSKRHAYSLHYKVGARQDGTLTAVEARMVSDAGPYAGVSPLVIDQACIFSCGPYLVPNARIEGWAVYTNNANGGAFRGFGINQAAFALESSLDMLARKLGLDPFELRLRNALEVGKPTISGEILRASVPMKETLRAAREALGWMSLPKTRKRIGVGVAAGFKNVGVGKGTVDNAGATIELTKEGDILLRVSTVDMGQGNRTTMAQLAAEAIGVSYDRIKLVTGDTDLVHKATGGSGERQTFCGGNAVLGASRQFREVLLSYVARQYDTSPARLSLADENILEGDKPLLTLGELGRFTAGEGEVIQADYYYLAPKTYPFSEHDLTDRSVGLERYGLVERARVKPEEYRNYPSYAYTTQVAIVEVDERTGEVKVLKIIAAHDVGRALNPLKIEGQLEGSCLMGLGYALSEEYVLKGGIPLTNTLGKCRIPTIQQTPEVECIIIEDPEPNGPLGAKGISEVATVPSTPAIINAIYDAVGVRITDLPATREKVLAALRARQPRYTAGG